MSCGGLFVIIRSFNVRVFRKRLEESNEMKEKQKKKTVSVREASIVLLIIVATIATGVIGLKISPNITILFCDCIDFRLRNVS